MTTNKYGSSFSPARKLFYGEIKSNRGYLGRISNIIYYQTVSTVSMPNLETAEGGTWGTNSYVNSVSGVITIDNRTTFNWSLLLGGDVVKIIAGTAPKVVDVPLPYHVLDTGDLLPFGEHLDVNKEIVVGTYTGDTPTKASEDNAFVAGEDYLVLPPGVELIKPKILTPTSKISISATNASYSIIDAYKSINCSVTLYVDGDGQTSNYIMSNIIIQLPPGFNISRPYTIGNNAFELPFIRN